MTLFLYQARALFLYSGLIFGLLFSIAWLDDFAKVAAQAQTLAGEPLGLLMKLAISGAWALPSTLDFSVIVFMLAALISLTLMGRRAELHILRGAGQSGGTLLMRAAFAAVLLSLGVSLIARPLGYDCLLYTSPSPRD